VVLEQLVVLVPEQRVLQVQLVQQQRVPVRQ
jgi:hypothetical protein